MDEWLTGVVAAAAIPALAAVVKLLVTKALESKTKEVVTTDAEGKTETVIVSATAGPEEIRNRIREVYSFEAEVGAALQKLQEQGAALKLYPSKQVDFIVEMPKGKLALEVKLGLDRIDKADLQKYLNAESGLNHLLLVSRTQPSERLLESLKNLVNERQVSMLTIPEGADPMPLIERSVKRIASDTSGA